MISYKDIKKVLGYAGIKKFCHDESIAYSTFRYRLSRAKTKNLDFINSLSKVYDERKRLIDAAENKFVLK